jgi:hypothetical protein
MGFKKFLCSSLEFATAVFSGNCYIAQILKPKRMLWIVIFLYKFNIDIQIREYVVFKSFNYSRS